MRFNYFKTWENLYCKYFDKNKPLVLRFDAVSTTRSTEINIQHQDVGTFSYALINTAKELSLKYNTIVFCGTDEINLILIDIPQIFNNKKVQRISSVFSQEIFQIFNKYYKEKIIFFDGKCFNIPYDKIVSYIHYRQLSTKLVNYTYFAKRHLKKSQYVNQKLSVIETFVNNTDSYVDYQYFQEGLTYLNGKLINIDDYQNYIFLD